MDLEVQTRRRKVITLCDKGTYNTPRLNLKKAKAADTAPTFNDSDEPADEAPTGPSILRWIKNAEHMLDGGKYSDKVEIPRHTCYAAVIESPVNKMCPGTVALVASFGKTDQVCSHFALVLWLIV